MWLRLLKKGNLYSVPEILCAFRSHDQAATKRNHHSMMDLLDAIRLGHEYFAYLEELGETREHFHQRVVEFAALQVDHRVRHEGLSDAAVRRHGVDGGPGSAVNLEDDFAQALFLALRYISPTLSELDPFIGVLESHGSAQGIALRPRTRQLAPIPFTCDGWNLSESGLVN